MAETHAAVTEDAIASLFGQHTTSSTSRTDLGWDWSCSCGEKGYAAEHEFCQRLTRGHWANVIGQLLADALHAERERVLEELAKECCPACRDKAPFVWSDEDMRCCHPRGNAPLFFCQAPAGVRKRLAELRARSASHDLLPRNTGG